jgi:hypothetical protein
MLNCFIYWDNGIEGMPPMIEYIYEHNLYISLKYNFNLVLISDNNITKYIDIHNKFFELKSNFKSDIIRYNILHKYGGIWLDTDVIILKNLNEIYNNFLETKYMCILDIEYDNSIGCASIFMKENTICSKYCVDFVNNYLDSNKPLECGCIGPNTVRTLYNEYPDLIKLNTYEIVKNGCNFISWKDDPGHEKDKWIMDQIDAEAKAQDIYINENCYYVITWTIYRKNDIKDDIINFVFKNKISVFHHLLNLSKLNQVTFNVLIATVGRPTLQNMINSLNNQLKENDCLTIVFDGHSSLPSFDFSKLKCKINQYFEPINLGYWGHGIRNKYSDLLEKRDFIMHADDDNIYSKDSFNFLREKCINTDTLYIGYMKVNKFIITPNKNIIKEGDIDTACGIIPYDLNLRGKWLERYGGDGAFYEQISVHANKIVFLEKICYIKNPSKVECIDNDISDISDISNNSKKTTLESKIFKNKYILYKYLKKC